MKEKNFKGLSEKLASNIYGSLKGTMRLQLILEDILAHSPEFEKGGLTVLDIGGGSGKFSMECTGYRHHVLLYDCSRKVLDRAEESFESNIRRSFLETASGDFLAESNGINGQFDLVAMHGSAEWMNNTKEAILKATFYVKPGALMSLLVFNKDKYLLKRGISGHLLKSGGSIKKHSLTPPGALSPFEIRAILDGADGRTLCQSGIRVFFNFFRQLPQDILTPGEWLEQEKKYCRIEPFRSLGEHTHFIWQKKI